MRGVLAILAGLAFGSFRKEVSRKFGSDAGAALVIVTLCQFHLPFYMSRPLSNTFALILGMMHACEHVGFCISVCIISLLTPSQHVVLLSYKYWLQERYVPMIRVAVLTAVVFRSEVVLIYAPTFIEALIARQIKPVESFATGLVALVASLGKSLSL